MFDFCKLAHWRCKETFEENFAQWEDRKKSRSPSPSAPAPLSGQSPFGR